MACSGFPTVHLIQVLVPVRDNAGHPYPRELHQSLGAELTERFGGLTAYTRSPAIGVWKAEPQRTEHDEIVVYEVMAERLDRDWWAGFRTRWERRLGQEVLVVRALAITQL
jgi:hypothetical protein